MQESVKQDRWKYIGGSDIPTIMGISKFKTRYALLLEKAQIKDDDFPGNEYTEYGNVMEPKIREYLNKKKKKPFLEDQVIDGDLRYHSDGWDGTTVLEIKTTSHTYQNINDYMIYLVQLLFGIRMHGKKKGKLAVYQRPEDFSEDFDPKRLQIFDINIEDHADIVEEIEMAIDQFREDLEKVKADPFLLEIDLMPVDIKKMAYAVEALEKELTDIKAKEKQIGAQSEAIKDKLRKAMTEAGITKWEMPGGTKIANVPDLEDKEVEVFDEKAFMKDDYRTYKKYLKKQLKKGKKGYLRITLPKDGNDQ